MSAAPGGRANVRLCPDRSLFRDLKEIVEFVAQDNANAATRLGEKLVERAVSDPMSDMA